MYLGILVYLVSKPSKNDAEAIVSVSNGKYIYISIFYIENSTERLLGRCLCVELKTLVENEQIVAVYMYTRGVFLLDAELSADFPTSLISIIVSVPMLNS